MWGAIIECNADHTSVSGHATRFQDSLVNLHAFPLSITDEVEGGGSVGDVTWLSCRSWQTVDGRGNKTICLISAVTSILLGKLPAEFS